MAAGPVLRKKAVGIDACRAMAGRQAVSFNIIGVFGVARRDMIVLSMAFPAYAR